MKSISEKQLKAGVSVRTKFLFIIAEIFTMKTSISTFAFSLLLLLGTITSCTKNKPQDPCLAKTCLNGGSCVMGECECPAGYSGDGCEINNRDRVLGVYNSVVNTGSGYCNPTAFEIIIEVSSLGSNYVLIKNINGYGANLFGTVNPHNSPTINIPSQVFGNNSFNGYLNMQSDNITGGFSIDRSNPYGYCTGTITRKP